MSDPEAAWRLPEPLSTLDVQVDGDTVIKVRRHGNPAGPRLVLSHGNGLAIDLYYPFWSLLEDEFDLVLYDLRNHGWNEVGSLDGHTVPTIARDQDTILEAVDAEYGEKPKAGVFHSFSALTTLLSPGKCRGFSGLFLFDPPLRRPGISHEEFDEASIKTAGSVRRRGHRFKSRQAFVELLGFSPNYRNAVPGVLELMAETTLRELPSGEGYELICPPEYEAQIIEYGRLFAVSIDFAELACPVKAFGADPTLPYTYIPTLDLGDIREVDYDFLPDATHFLPFEQPEACAGALREFLEQQGLR
ncbi:MAG: alpha/beta hydrolase [Dehalococcoidia bacterium]|nr:alpha/beta hydrolase [Dehalococcoidia bacterium]MXZ89457.1 alpha/beta hydrolase [Dehalococcoidia bacterium]MYI86614.1 alpha/beta hydrolase [Dehalococcoidia bacterium]